MMEAFKYFFSNFRIANLNISFEISENVSHNFSSFKGESVWPFTLDDDNKNISGGGTCAPFFYF